MANSQHRCVFVGNIPYDASEEQLIQICEEVGPVVSFRLVVERETGKPKGYGFCEYKDEETALSARRNLQGYEINGRQLRVDFAENDKGADRNREQGRGGPGMTANADVQKQGRGLGDSSLQPIGLPLAMAAASVMAGTLGGGQTGIKCNQNGLQNQLGFGNDPLTLHLARMSKNQLTEIINDLKVMAAQNKELARKLLLSNPQLPKALFQAEIMIGIVPTQMFQMANIQQVSGSKLPIQDGQQVQQLSVQTIPGQSSLAQNNTLSGLMPKSQVGQIAAVPQSSLLPGQFPILPQATAHPQIQPPQLVSSQVLHQSGTLRGQSGVSTLPSIHSQPLANFSVRPQTHLANSSSLKQHMQPSLPPNSVQNVSVNLGYNNQPLVSNAVMQPSLVRPLLSERGFKPDRSAQIADDAAWVNIPEPINRPSKLVKLDDGRVNSISVSPTVPDVSGVSQAFGTGLMSANQTSPAEEVKHSEKQVPLLLDVESALLQQVMSLTPEQLSSLPPEQQQQVIQLQQMLR